MSLYTLGEILKLADKGKFAVPAFNCYNFETIFWAAEAAQEEKMPVILMIYPGFEEAMPLEYFVSTARMAAERASAPVAVHLDHCYDYNHILQAAHLGCTGVMIDASSRPFEENARLTKEVAQAAHAIGCHVEAELGRVGSADNADDFCNADAYTSAEEAVRFCGLTGVDALAVAIGSAHGAYVKEPKLDIERLDAINRAVETPLVLHGGSGIPVSQLQDAVRHGINKVNIATEYFAEIYKAIENKIESGTLGRKNHYDLMLGIKGEIKDFIKERLHMLHP